MAASGNYTYFWQHFSFLKIPKDFRRISQFEWQQNVDKRKSTKLYRFPSSPLQHPLRPDYIYRVYINKLNISFKYSQQSVILYNKIL